MANNKQTKQENTHLKHRPHYATLTIITPTTLNPLVSDSHLTQVSSHTPTWSARGHQPPKPSWLPAAGSSMCSCSLPCPLPSQQHKKTSLTCALSILNKGAGLPRPRTLKRGSSWMPPVFRGCGDKWKSTVSILGELYHVLPEYHPSGPGRPYLCHLCAGHGHLPGSPWVRSWGHCQGCGELCFTFLSTSPSLSSSQAD